MIDRTHSFVLLENGSGPARLYTRPVEIVTANHAVEVRPALEQIRGAAARGLHAAGYLAYEAGAGIEPRMPARDIAAPLVWFGLFEAFERVDDLAGLLPDPAAAYATAPVPRITEAEHAAALATVQARIAAGDIYQANLTFPCDVRVAGDPRALYARLRGAAAAPWSALVWTGETWLLSFSPELFFTLESGRLTARPMKGTAARGGDDAGAAALLAADPKQRAENLMIVDLLRNDLARVAEPGSVAVPALFAVETYPTLHQMTSTVTATLAGGCDAVDVLAAAFPCGSITGAPKIRAMEIIAEVERCPRGAYTGSIGRIDADGDAAFNVAIRTLVLPDGAGLATLGLGSGIVADSEPAAEWRECLAKGAFVTTLNDGFDLVETMCFEPREGLAELEAHLARMKASADALGFAFDRHDLRNELQAATFRLRGEKRVRVMLSRTGKVAIEVGPRPFWPARPIEVAVVPLPVDVSDVRLRHKTSDRGFYDAARLAARTEEVVFVRPDGLLTEGSFTDLFVERDGRLVTPPLDRGLLPGVLRARLLADGRAVEGDLQPADLARGFLLGNAVRGLGAARVVARQEDARL